MSNTPAINLAELPAAQRAAVEALMQEVSALKDITKRQEHLIAELNHALHGKRSEKLTEDERQLAFEDLTIAVEEVEAEKETRAASQGDGTRKKPAPRRNVGNLPASLPRIENVIVTPPSLPEGDLFIYQATISNVFRFARDTPPLLLLAGRIRWD